MVILFNTGKLSFESSFQSTHFLLLVQICFNCFIIGVSLQLVAEIMDDYDTWSLDSSLIVGATSLVAYKQPRKINVNTTDSSASDLLRDFCKAAREHFQGDLDICVADCDSVLKELKGAGAR